MDNWSENITYQKELNELCKLKIPYDKLQDQRILITGANGLICSYLIDALMKMNELLHLNIYITALTRSREKAQRRFADYLDMENFSLLLGDVCHKELYKNQNWDYIIHGAGNAHPKAFAAQPVETMKANLLGTMNILDYAVSQEVTCGVKKIVFLSTGEVYGHAQLWEEPMEEKYREVQDRATLENQKEIGTYKGWREDTPGVIDSMVVRSCYPESKRAAETLCQSYYQEYDVRAVVARLCYIYGATISDQNSRADAQFLRNVLAGEDIVMKSEGTQVRSYCYLQDAAAALLFLLLKGEAGEVYNVANQNSIASIREYAECMAKIFGVNIKMDLLGAAEEKGYSRMQQEILNENKLRRLGWKAEHTLEDGMRKIYEIYQLK